MPNLKVPGREAKECIDFEAQQKIWAGVTIRMDDEVGGRLNGAVLSNRNTM